MIKMIDYQGNTVWINPGAVRVIYTMSGVDDDRESYFYTVIDVGGADKYRINSTPEEVLKVLRGENAS